jgi:hypothetical protein
MNIASKIPLLSPIHDDVNVGGTMSRFLVGPDILVSSIHILETLYILHATHNKGRHLTRSVSVLCSSSQG